MKIYRYEHQDGGGPYCDFRGYPRDMNVNFPIDTSYLYGCLSIDKLNKYFENHQDLIKDCKIYVYDIPDDDVKINEYQVQFPKKYYKNKKEYKGQ